MILSWYEMYQFKDGKPVIFIRVLLENDAILVIE